MDSGPFRGVMGGTYGANPCLLRRGPGRVIEAFEKEDLCWARAVKPWVKSPGSPDSSKWQTAIQPWSAKSGVIGAMRGVALVRGRKPRAGRRRSQETVHLLLPETASTSWCAAFYGNVIRVLAHALCHHGCAARAKGLDILEAGLTGRSRKLPQAL